MRVPNQPAGVKMPCHMDAVELPDHASHDALSRLCCYIGWSVFFVIPVISWNSMGKYFSVLNIHNLRIRTYLGR